MITTGKNSFPQGRAHQLAIQYQMVSLESICTSHIIQTEQVVFETMHTYKYINMHITIINFKEGHEFGREKYGVYRRVMKEKKEEGNM